MAEGNSVRVTVIYSPAPREVREWVLLLPAGSTVLDAMEGTTLLQEFPSIQAVSAACGVWGRRCTPAELLRDGDRVEIYRPLHVDPKVARRQRFQKQGARAAGLFARKR